MKKELILFSFSLLLSLNVYSYENNYNVRGVISGGGAVHGNAFDLLDQDNVYGQLIDENGLAHSYEGKWIDNGIISGETDDGEEVQLSTR